MKNTKGIFILLVLASVLGAAIWWKVDAVSHLRSQRTRLQAGLADLVRLRELNVRYKSALSVDNAKWQRDANAVPISKMRIEQLKETLSQLSALPPPTAGSAADYTALWRNLGLSTPTNTLHSIIWASLNGDVEALGSMLIFDPEGRDAVETLWSGLSESLRAQYSTSPKLMATLIAGRITPAVYQAELKEATQEQPDVMRAVFTLKNATANGVSGKFVSLRFQRDSGGWKLLVPKSVITEYKRSLEAP